MRTLRSCAAAALAVAGMVGAAVPAAADDDFRYDRAFWTGMYGGFHLGHGDAGGVDGFVGGAQIGRNWVKGKMVYGWEADATISGMEESFEECILGACVEGEASVDWMATARGRLGYLFQPNLMGYATAGLGIVSGSASESAFGREILDVEDTETGFVIGFGGEYKYSDTTSVRAEYLNVDDIDVIRAGLNFKLNGF